MCTCTEKIQLPTPNATCFFSCAPSPHTPTHPWSSAEKIMTSLENTVPLAVNNDWFSCKTWINFSVLYFYAQHIKKGPSPSSQWWFFAPLLWGVKSVWPLYEASKNILTISFQQFRVLIRFHCTSNIMSMIIVYVIHVIITIFQCLQKLYKDI